jgi:hypothetical protein
MVTKGYRKGVYERVTKGIRAEREVTALVQTRYVAAMENCVVFRLRFERARLRSPCQGLFSRSFTARLKAAPFQDLVPRPTEETKEHDMD